MSVLVKRSGARWKQSKEDLEECEKYVEKLLSLGS